MTDANDERMYVEGIKKRCHPDQLNDQTRQVLEVMVEMNSGLRNAPAVRELTSRFAQETHAELAGRSMDDLCYESERHFMRSMALGIASRAQEYEQTMNAERQLSRNDGKSPGR